jgi:hypothetical protein
MLLCRKLGNGDEIELRKHFRKRFAYNTLLNLRTKGDSCVHAHRERKQLYLDRKRMSSSPRHKYKQQLTLGAAVSREKKQLCPQGGSSCVHREETAVSTGRKQLFHRQEAVASTERKQLRPQRGSSFVHREEAAVSTERKQLRPQRGCSCVYREEAAFFTEKKQLCPRRRSSCVHGEEAAASRERKQLCPHRKQLL